jgi:hypothetical protein
MQFCFVAIPKEPLSLIDRKWFDLESFFMSTGADWSPAHQLRAQEQTNQEKNEVNIHYSHDYCKFSKAMLPNQSGSVWGIGILDLGEIRIQFRIQFQIVCDLKKSDNFKKSNSTALYCGGGGWYFESSPILDPSRSN